VPGPVDPDHAKFTRESICDTPAVVSLLRLNPRVLTRPARVFQDNQAHLPQVHPCPNQEIPVPSELAQLAVLGGFDHEGVFFV